jgi:hypothetical protein
MAFQLSEIERFNKKKQDELLQFNQALSDLEGKIELCISLDEYAMEDALEEELEFEEEEQEREMREEFIKKQQEIQLNQQHKASGITETSPENKFFMKVSASSMELFSSVFNSFAKNYSHMDYEDHELGCDMNEEKSEVNLRFPTAHIARCFLDHITKMYPQLVLCMMSGANKAKEQEEQALPAFSRMREHMLNPFKTELTRD